MTTHLHTFLEVRDLSNSYAGEPLLQNVNFSLAEGEILCLLGPSGSGKTTLLRILAGLEDMDSGTILFENRDIKHIPPHKRNIGMMFQEYALFPHKNVWQNVAFGLEMQKYSTERTNRTVEKMLKLVGLSGFEQRTIDELSGGERQRVALARSLAPEPQILLLDEPLGSLDRTLRDRLTIEIRTILKKLKVTAVFVTHDQGEALSVADKVAILQEGILQQFDTPENVYRYPINSTVARFLGFTNLIDGKIEANNTFHSPIGTIELLQPCNKNADSVLLIRPDGGRISKRNCTQTQPVITGTVTSVTFQGSTYRLRLLVESVILSFDLPIDPQPPAVNKAISLALNPSALVFIKK